MKAFKMIVWLMIGLVIGVLGAVGVYFLTVGEVAWQEYFETKLIPNVVIVISAIGSLSVVALPIISKVQLALEKFNKATTDISLTVENGKKTDDTLTCYDNKIATFNERFNLLETKLDNTLIPLITNINRIDEVCKIGFCNMDELIQKGYATEINKVGNNNGTKEKTEI